MTQYVFGTGQLFIAPQDGGAALKVGALQDVSVDISGDIKMLYGQYQFPLDVARGKTKLEGKFSSGNIDVGAYNNIFFGQTVASGQKTQVINEVAAIPASTPFTVTAANGATFFMDLGVYFDSTGLPLKQVASAPATGEYEVNPLTGVYTFAAADEGKSVLLNYFFTNADAGGTLDINNLLMGTTPKFRLVASQTYEDQVFTICLYSVVSDKLSLPLKQDDYVISDISFSAQADAANRVGFISSTSIAGGGG